MRGLRGALVVAAVVLGASSPRAATAEAAREGSVDEARLRMLDGGAANLVEKGSAASVLVFFRSGNDRSVDALRAMGECQASFGAKPVRFVGVVSDRDPPADVRAAVASAGSRLPVLVDEGDAIYARLGYVLDRARRIVAFEPYRQVGLADAVRAHVRRALGEITAGDEAKALAPAQSTLPGEDPTGVAIRHVRFGRKLLAAGAVGTAHENARRSLALAPTAAGWALEGDAFRAEGKCAEAATAYAAALKLDPASGEALAGRKACGP
jgi:tetratricopeptide (TPR) repeat protein